MHVFYASVHMVSSSVILFYQFTSITSTMRIPYAQIIAALCFLAMLPVNGRDKGLYGWVSLETSALLINTTNRFKELC